MKSAIGAITCALAVFVGTASGSAQQAGAADEAAIAKEVNAFMDQYYELWSAGRIDDLVERIYHPFGQLSNQGHSTIEQMKARFPDMRKGMLAKGYARSQLLDRRICVVSPTVAIASGRGVRYLTDGKLMGEYGWTYTLIKGPAGWRMVSIYSHEPGKTVTCGS